MPRAAIRILGIDPGLRNMGWGLIEAEGTRLAFIACGTVHSDAALTLGERLRALHEGLAAIVAMHGPDEAAIEETFVNRDPQSALKLGHARAIGVVVPALAGIAVHEYPANVVKKTVVGAGHADKRQVGMMVRMLLPRADAQSADAADALAVAICHAHHRIARQRLARLQA
jgi:crossover junction endodeoxyribonuclease RuvC